MNKENYLKALVSVNLPIEDKKVSSSRQFKNPFRVNKTFENQNASATSLLEQPN